MRSRLDSFFRPTRYADEDENRIAGLVNAFLTLAIIFVSIRAVSLLPGLPHSALFFAVAVAIALASLGPLWLAGHGHVRPAAQLAAGLYWLGINAASAAAGGIDQPLFANNLALLIFVTLTLGTRAMFGFALADLGVGLVLIVAKQQGLLPPPGGVLLATSTQVINIVATAVYLGFTGTSLQTALRRARKSETEYRTLFEEAPYGICIADSANRIIFTNPATQKLLGYDFQEALGRSVADFVAPEDLVHRPLRDPEELRQEDSAQRERLLIRKDGTRVPALISSKAMADGRFQYILQDISARRAADEALRRSEQIHRQAIEASGLVPYYQVYTGPDRTEPVFTYIGEGIYNMTGYKPGEFTSPLFDGMILESRLAGDAAQYPYDEAVRRTRSGEIHIWKCDYRIRTRDGGVRWLSDAALELFDEDWTTLGSIGTFQDVTERKQAVEEVQRLNTELEERVAARTAELAAANRELESFGYSVSHDLRAPLRAVNGFAHVLLEDYGGQLPPEAGEHLDRIIKSTERMGVLIDDLLDFSRLGRRPLDRRPTRTVDLVLDVLSETAPGPERPAEISLGVLPDCLADPSLLRQVYENLLTNAFKYTSKRPVAQIEIGWEDGAYFVRDNGAGFDMRYVDKLFGVFQRLHSEAEFEGTGIGLAIVKRIVTRHGGQVWAEGEVDKGAAFYFTLAAG